MKKLVLLALLLPALALAQTGLFGHGGGGSGLTASQMLATIADSSTWTDGSTTNRIKPRDGKSLEADSIKAAYLNVTGDMQLDGNLTMNTIATEQVKLGTGSNAAPELSSVGDPNTGIRFPGSDVTTFVQGGSEKMHIASTGNVTIGATGGYDRLGIINSSSGQGTGLGLTSSQWNKTRTTWATSRDTSAIGLYIDSAGGPRMFMRAVDGDTLGVTLDGSEAKISSGSIFGLYVGTSIRLYMTTTETQFPNMLPLNTDQYSIGSATRKVQNYYGSDNIYLGGKGQTATMTWGQQNTMTEQSDSTGVLTMRNGNPLIKLFSGLGNQLNFCGQRAATYDAEAWDMWFSTGGSSGTDTLWISIDGTNAASIVFGARAAKH